MGNFQTALDALKRGERVARKGWKNGFLFLACGIDFYTTANLGDVYKNVGGENDGVGDTTWHYDCGPAWKRQAICFCPRHEGRGEISVGWLPKFEDLFAEDWFIEDNEKKKTYVKPNVNVRENVQETEETEEERKESENERRSYTWDELDIWDKIISRFFGV